MPRVNLTLNFRFLGCCLLAFIVLGGTLHGAYHFQWGRNSARLLASADKAEADGKTDRAVRFLAQYVKRVPTDAEVETRLGQLLDQQVGVPGARAQARGVYEQVLMRDPNREDVRRRLALLALEQGDYSAARSHLDLLLKDDRQDAELEIALGRCLEEQRKPEEAEKHYKKAQGYDKHRVESYARRAGVLRGALNQPEKAKEVIDEMVGKNLESYQAYLARADYHLRQTTAGGALTPEALKQAGEDVAKALELAPDKEEVLFVAAEVAQKQGKGLEVARGYLKQILTKYPRAIRVHESLAGLELQEGRPDEAIKWLEAGLKVAPEHTNLLWNLANVLIERDRQDEAGRILDKLEKLKTEPGRVDLLKAALQVRKEKWSDAIHTLESIRPFFSRDPRLLIHTDFLLARCYEGQNNPEKGLSALRRILTVDPLHAQARMAVANALMKTGRVDESLSEYQQIMESPRPPKGGWLILARLLATRNLGLPPAQRDWRRVEEILGRAAQEDPAAVEVPIMRAQVLIHREQPDEARALLEKESNRQPKRLEFWLARAGLEEQVARPDVGQKILDEAEKRLGDSTRLRLARIGYLVGRGDASARQALQRLGDGVDKFPVEDQAGLLGALGDAAYQLKDLNEARRLWGQAAELEPRSVSARLRLFDLSLEKDDKEAAQAALAAIQKVEGPSQAMALYSEARLLIWQAAKDGDTKGLARARSLLATVESRRPRWGRVALARAQIDEVENNSDRAIEDYLRAVELGERQLGPIRRLIQLLYEKRRYAEVELVLRKLPEQVIVSGQLQQMAATASLEMGDFARALELARKAVPADSKDYRDHIWMGQVLWAATAKEADRAQKVKNLQKAEDAFRKAVGLKETAPAAWVTLVQFLARTGRTQEAEKAVEDARAKLPRDEADLALTQCYADVNRLDRAREHLQAALKAKPEDVTVLQAAADFYLRTNDLEEAKKSLQGVIAKKNKDPDAARRAQRLLPVVLAAGGSYQQSREALAMLGLLQEDKTAGRTETVEDLRVRAVVLSTQLGLDQTREAVRILEGLDQRQPLSSEDQFLLVQLYDRLGEKRKFRDRLDRLVAANAESPRFLAYQVSILLRQKDLVRAEGWLANLEKLQPEAPAVIELRARLLKAQGKDDEVVRLITNKIPAKDAATTLAVANLFEQLGQQPAAKKYYKKYVGAAKKPEAVLVLARYLGRQNDLAEALSLCAGAWKTCPAETVGYATMAVLHAGQPSEEHFRQVQVELANALRKAPGDKTMILCQADLAEMRGRFDEAEALYRKVLQADRRNAVALNNLAWLVALRQPRPEALALVNQAIDVLGPIPELIDTRAVVYLALGQPNEALKDLQEAVARPAVEPKVLASVGFHLAKAYNTAGKRDEAVKALRGPAANVDPTILHPLERDSYTKLRDDLLKEAR